MRRTTHKSLLVRGCAAVVMAVVVWVSAGADAVGQPAVQPVQGPVPAVDALPEVSGGDGVEHDARVVEELPDIAPETSVPAAPPPADVSTRSDGTVAGSRVPTGQGGQPRSAPQARTPETLEEPWTSTVNPRATVVPGQMRSDREPIPAGFTKADADKAETMEARINSERSLRVMAAPGCQVYWPAPFEVCGAIRDKYNALGGPNSFLLFPKTNELTNPDGVGKRTEFMNGPIYWSPQGGAHPVVNHFLAAWARHGYENSYIGYPTTDEIVNPDGIGRRQHFTGSTIYWHLNEAYSIGGAIADKWNSLGAERGQLGYPISDELVLPDGQGRMNRFQHGVIYWHPTTGAHEITGNILSEWSSAGFERSGLRYPIEAPNQEVAGATSQRFQGGYLTDLGPSVGIPNNALGISFGVKTQSRPIVTSDGPWTSVEDQAVKFSIRSDVLQSVNYQLEFKNLAANNKFSYLLGIPREFRAVVSNSARVGIFTAANKEIGAIQTPVAISDDGTWHDVSASTLGTEVTYRVTVPTVLRAAQGMALDSYGQAISNGWEDWKELGPTERDTCAADPIQCKRAKSAWKDAVSRSTAEYPGKDSINNRVDAARHCIWQGLTTERANASFAEAMAEAHELDKPSEGRPQDDAMDRYNNATGRQVGLRLENQGDKVQNVCIRYSHEARIVDPPPTSNPNGIDLIILYE